MAKSEFATSPTPSRGDAMAQADSITTAIRELMSRGRPPNSTNPGRAAHTDLVAALAGNAPRLIRPKTDCEALESRADHLQRVLAALQVYVTAIVADMGEKIPSATVDRQYLDQLFRGVSAEALQVFRNAAAEIRRQEHRRAS